MDKYHHHFHITRHLHLSRFLHNRYNELIIADSFRTIAISMISLFVPIFLLQKGIALATVIVYELLIFVGALILHYFLIVNLPRFGVKRVMVAGYLINVVFYLCLHYAEVFLADFGQIAFLTIIGFLNVVYFVFYWTALHMYFLKSTRPKESGRKLGVLLGIPTIAGIAGPFIGSVLITGFGFHAVFLISALLMILASIALSFTKDIPVKVNIRWKRILDLNHPRKNLIYFLQGIGYSATGYIWPIFLFLASVKLISMGFLYLFSNMAYATVSYLAGRRSDSKSPRGIGRIGATGQGLSIVFRALSETVAAMTAWQTLGGFFGGLLHISVDTGFYKNSHRDAGNRLMNRELYMFAGRILSMCTLLVALATLEPLTALISVLAASGLAVFLLNIVIKKEGFIFRDYV